MGRGNVQFNEFNNAKADTYYIDIDYTDDESNKNPFAWDDMVQLIIDVISDEVTVFKHIPDYHEKLTSTFNGRCKQILEADHSIIVIEDNETSMAIGVIMKADEYDSDIHYEPNDMSCYSLYNIAGHTKEKEQVLNVLKECFELRVRTGPWTSSLITT